MVGSGDTGRPRLIPSRTDVAIVGGGAAGLATAIFIRRARPDVDVAVFDGATRLGAKILVSGGSRCNVTNAVVSARDFNGGRRTIVRRVLGALPVPATVGFFEELGVRLHEEAHGKLFPDTNRSRDVLDALLGELANRGARVYPGCRVTAVNRQDGAFAVATSRGEVRAESVVLATGGKALPKSGSDGHGYAIARALGHTIVPPTPALVPLLLDEAQGIHRRLAGVAHDVELSLWLDGALDARFTGAMLWTHFGISGPAVLDASRHWLRAALERRPARLAANLVPPMSFESLDQRLVAAIAGRTRASIGTVIGGLLPESVAAAVLETLGLTPSRPAAHLSREDRRRIARAMTEWPLAVVGSRGYTYAEATAGGVALEEIDPATMQSRRCPGLFLVGEILDVDGRLGGFNFQWAWASARQAARGIAA